MRRPALVCALLIALLHAPGARAQDRDPAAAEVLFREGRAAADAGDHAKACTKFRESNRLDPAPGTVFNMADCEEKLGRIATAWTLFSEVIQKLPATDERHGISSKRAAALEPRLPRLTISVAAGADARVFRDGVELKAGSLDTPLPVDPGKHVLAIEAPGRARAERTIEIAEGASRHETLEPGPAVATTPRPAEGSSSSTRRTLGWVAGGVGVAGLAVGGVTGILVLGKKSVVDEHCDDAKKCDTTGIDAADAGKTLGTISGVGLIAGGVLLAAGVTLIVTSGSDKESGRAALTVGPRGLTLTGRF